jgi:hypothetical protein
MNAVGGRRPISGLGAKEASRNPARQLRLPSQNLESDQAEAPRPRPSRLGASHRAAWRKWVSGNRDWYEFGMSEAKSGVGPAHDRRFSVTQSELFAGPPARIGAADQLAERGRAEVAEIIYEQSVYPKSSHLHKFLINQYLKKDTRYTIRIVPLVRRAPRWGHYKWPCDDIDSRPTIEFVDTHTHIFRVGTESSSTSPTNCSHCPL